MQPMKKGLLKLFTKKNCGLCDDAKASLMRLKSKKVQLEIEEVDIMRWPDNKKWHDLYMFDIPVCHFNDKELFRHRVTDEEQLLLKIEKELESMNSDNA